MAKNPLKTLRNKTDKLLTPIALKQRPKCEACGKPAQVGHHMIEKSRSNNLRYDVEKNIVSLCHVCHSKIHNRFGSSITDSHDIVDVIIAGRGNDWYENLKKEGRKIIKVNKAWYEENLARLSDILDCG